MGTRRRRGQEQEQEQEAAALPPSIAHGPARATQCAAAKIIDLCQSASSSVGASGDGHGRRRPGSPLAATDAGREWRAWLRATQEGFRTLKGMDPDEIFSTYETRQKAAAFILSMRQFFDDSIAPGLHNLHGDIQELAERAGAWRVHRS